MTVRHLSLILGIAALLLATSFPAPAQGRGRGSSTGGRTTRAPSRSPAGAGRGGTVAPRGARSGSGLSRDRLGRWARLRRIEERVDPDDDVGGGGARGRDKKEKPEERARRGREFVTFLKRDAAKVRDVEIAWTVRVLEAAGGHRLFDVIYKGITVDRTEMRHRLEVWEVVEGRPRRVAAWLLHEALGGLTRMWMATPGKSPELLARRELSRGVAGTRLRLIDLVPFHPSRYRLTFEGDAARGGKEVMLFKASDRLGLGERYEIAIDTDRRLLVKATGRAAGRGKVTIVDSGLRVRDDSAAFERRHIVFDSSGDQIVAKMVKRKPNGGVDARLFEVATFEF